MSVLDLKVGLVQCPSKPDSFKEVNRLRSTAANTGQHSNAGSIDGPP